MDTLIKYYETQLEKVRAIWLAGTVEGTFDWERGMEYVNHAEANLDAVKNGRTW